jgi:hypothetical protein
MWCTRDQLTDWFQRRWAAFKTADMKVSIADTQRHHQRGDEWFLSIDLSSGMGLEDLHRSRPISLCKRH